MVADLSELHHQVHERASRIGVAKVRRLGEQVRDRDIGDEDSVQLPLSSTKVVNLNLRLRKLPQGTCEGE